MRVILFLFFLNTFFIENTFSQSENKQTDIKKSMILAFEQERYLAANNYADQILNENSEDCEVWKYKAKILYNLNKQDDGIKAITKAINLCNEKGDPYFLRSVLVYISGDITLALEDVENAVKHSPENTDYIARKAYLLSKNNRFKEAIPVYSKVISKQPNNYLALIGRGRAYRKTKNFKKAISDFNKAIKVNKSEMIAYEERGFLYIDTGLYKKAILDFKTVSELTYENKEEILYAYSFNNLGYAYFKDDQLNEALDNINYSLSLNSENPFAYKNRALVYFKLNKIKEGCEDLQKAKLLNFKNLYGDEVDLLIQENCSK